MRKQFLEYDTMSDRREIMALFSRLGERSRDPQAARAAFLQSLIGDSDTGLSGAPLKVTPCGAVEAYRIFVMIVGVLGVPINVAARKLEQLVRQQ